MTSVLSNSQKHLKFNKIATVPTCIVIANLNAIFEFIVIVDVRLTQANLGLLAMGIILLSAAIAIGIFVVMMKVKTRKGIGVQWLIL